jgi:chondroitin AC lyase
MRKTLLALILLVHVYTTIKAQTDIATLRANMLTSQGYSRQNLVPPSTPTTNDLLKSIQPNGSFSGAARTDVHLTVNIYKLAYEFKDPFSVYYNDATVKGKLYKALNYWLTDFPSDSWLNSGFGQPSKLGVVLVKLYDDFEADKATPEYGALITNVRKQAAAFIRYGWTNDKSRISFRQGGLGEDPGDGRHRIGNLAYRLFGLTSIAASINSVADLDTVDMMVSNQFALQINKANAETMTAVQGALYDGTLLQHGPQTYNTAYGRDWLFALSRYSNWVKGTKWALDIAQKEAWGDIVMNGMLWMYYKGRAPHNIMGRGNQQSGPATGSALYFLNDFIGQTDGQVRQHDKAVVFRDKFVANPAYQIDSSKYLWNSHLILHHSPNYFASVKMLSNRTTGAESSDAGTGHGLMNYHISDGSTLLYRTGKEYDMARVGWNWRAVPGTTVKQKTGALPLVPWTENYESDNYIAGGVSDGKVSIGVFNLDRRHSYHNTKAIKAYFTFPDMMLCLGNSITDSETTNENVHTTINQVQRIGDVVYKLNGGSEQTIAFSTTANLSLNITSPSWFWHDSTGYVVIPDKSLATNVLLKAEIRNGNWYKMDKRNKDSTVSVNIFQLGINHGNPSAWRDKSYRYVVVPNVSKEGLNNFVNAKILATDEASLYINYNTTSLVSASYAGYTGIFFTGSGSRSAADLGFDKLAVSTTNYAAVLLKRVATGMSIHVSDLRNGFYANNEVTLGFNRTFKPQTILKPSHANGDCVVQPGQNSTSITLKLSKTNDIYWGEPISIQAETAVAQVAVKTLVTVADAFVQSGTTDGTSNNTKNYGGAGYLVAQKDYRKTYLRFDVGDISNGFLSGKLVLHNLGDASTTSWQLYAVADNSWVEGTGNWLGSGTTGGITWNNAPAAGSLVATATGVSANKPVEFDITSLLKNLPEGQKYISFAVLATASDLYTSFRSKEGGQPTESPRIVYTTQEMGLRISAVEPVSESKADESIRFGPNPSDGVFHLWLPANSGSGVPVKIYDVKGKVILQREVTESEATFDLSNQPPGIYILEVALPGKTRQRLKIITLPRG